MIGARLADDAGRDDRAGTQALPPITASRPRIGIEPIGASIPFCNGMTEVCGPTIGLIASPALSTSHSLTQKST